MPFVHFYTLNFVRDITLKLQEVSTRNFVGRWISLSRCAIHMYCNSALPYFELLPFVHLLFKLCPGYSYRQYENYWLGLPHNIFMPNLVTTLLTNYFSVSKTHSGSITRFDQLLFVVVIDKIEYQVHFQIKQAWGIYFILMNWLSTLNKILWNH